MASVDMKLIVTVLHARVSCAAPTTNVFSPVCHLIVFVACDDPKGLFSDFQHPLEAHLATALGFVFSSH